MTARQSHSGRSELPQIAMPNPNLARSGQLTIDIIVNLPSGLRHVEALKLTTEGRHQGLHVRPLTNKRPACHVDIHTSYHANGETHMHLTRGKIGIASGDQTQIIDEACYRNREHPGGKVPLWEAQGRSWSSLRGVEEVCPNTVFFDINSLDTGYPVVSPEHHADYVFEIVAQSLTSTMISIRKFLVEPHDTNALQEHIGKIMDDWEHKESAVTWRAGERLIVEKAELLANLSPWLAIVVFCRAGE